MLDKVDVALTFSNVAKFSNVFAVFKVFSQIFAQIDSASQVIQAIRVKSQQSTKDMLAKRMHLLQKLKRNRVNKKILEQLKHIQLAKNSTAIIATLNKNNLSQTKKQIMEIIERPFWDQIIAKQFLPRQSQSISCDFVDQVRGFMLEDFHSALFSVSSINVVQTKTDSAYFILPRYFKTAIEVARPFNFQDFAQRTLIKFAEFNKTFKQATSSKGNFLKRLECFIDDNFLMFDQYRLIALATTIKILTKDMHLRDSEFVLDGHSLAFLQNLCILFGNILKDFVNHMREIYEKNEDIIRASKVIYKLNKLHTRIIARLEDELLPKFEPRLAHLNLNPSKAKAFLFNWTKVKSRINIDGVRESIKETNAFLLQMLVRGLEHKVDSLTSGVFRNPKPISQSKLRTLITEVLGLHESYDVFFEAKRKVIIVDENDQALFIPIDQRFENFFKLLRGLIVAFKDFPKIKEEAKDLAYTLFQSFIQSLKEDLSIEINSLLHLLNQTKTVEQAYKNMILLQIFSDFERNNHIFIAIKSLKSTAEEKFVKFVENKLNVDATLYISKYDRGSNDYLKLKSPSDELLSFLGEIKALIRVFDENLMTNMKKQCVDKLLIIKEKIIVRELDAMNRIRKIQPFVLKNEIDFLNQEFEIIIRDTAA